ncbi:Uncharacterised protein [Klebsiella pneumoniae]|nr:Uncharacterised protein [Klebsiella pneumoniae]
MAYLHRFISKICWAASRVELATGCVTSEYPSFIISTALFVSRLALPTPIMEAAQSMISCESDQPLDVGTRVMNPTKDMRGAIAVRVLPKTLPALPALTMLLRVTVRNQNRAMAQITPFRMPKREPITVVSVAVKGDVTTSPKMVTSAWRERSLEFSAASRMVLYVTSSASAGSETSSSNRPCRGCLNSFIENLRVYE